MFALNQISTIVSKPFSYFSLLSIELIVRPKIIDINLFSFNSSFYFRVLIEHFIDFSCKTFMKSCFIWVLWYFLDTCFLMFSPVFSLMILSTVIYSFANTAVFSCFYPTDCTEVFIWINFNLILYVYFNWFYNFNLFLLLLMLLITDRSFFMIYLFLNTLIYIFNFMFRYFFCFYLRFCLKLSLRLFLLLLLLFQFKLFHFLTKFFLLISI